MPMIASDLGRRVTLWVDAAGCVSLADKGVAVRGSLPVFSTDTQEQAEQIRVRFCRLARDGSGLYFLNEPPATVEGLGDVSEMFRRAAEARAS